MKRLILFLFPLWLLADAHIFVMHRVDDFRYPTTNISSQLLQKDIKYLLKNHYKIVKLSTLVNRIKNKKNINKYVVFTIDDSFKSFYENGLPVFKKYKVPFTLFVYTQATTEGYGDYMSWKQVKTCEKYGELGVHSWAHPHLAMLSNEEIINDTKKAVDSFKKYLGYVPDMYAYPYGEYNKRVKNIIKKFFPVICNQNEGAVTLDTPLDDIDRIAITGDVNIAKKLKIQKLNVKELTIKRDNNTIKEIRGYINKPIVDIYITTFGWKWVKVKNGYFNFKPNFRLKKYRNRIIIRYNNKIDTKLILKEK